MAYQTGTSTDYQDLLADLRTFCLANGWTSDRNTLGAEDEVIFHGDGGASDEIYVGIKTYSNAGPGYYNWELRGFTGFDNGKTFENQPGTSPPTYVPLQNASMDYWFHVDGRRICVVVKTSTSYQFMYAGFIDAYATDSEWSYPLLIMGSTHSQTQVFNSNALNYSSSINPGAQSISNAPAYLRLVDGSWFPVYNFTGSTSESHTDDGNKVSVWPQSDDSTSDYESPNTLFNGLGFRTRLCSSTQGGVPSALLFRTENNGGTAVVPLLPLILYRIDPSPQLLGEIHNVYWSMLTNGVTAEDVVNDGVTLDDYTIFQNIHRTDPWCGVAIKQE